MKYAHESLEKQFEKLDPRLIKVVFVMEALMMSLWDVELTVTSVWRQDPASPHNHYRAVDIRSRDLVPASAVYLTNILNLIFPYNRLFFQTVLLHDAGTGMHFHVQVAPR